MSPMHHLASRLLTAKPASATRATPRRMLTKVRRAITPWPGTARCAAAHAAVPRTACALLSGLSTLMRL